MYSWMKSNPLEPFWNLKFDIWNLKLDYCYKVLPVQYLAQFWLQYLSKENSFKRQNCFWMKIVDFTSSQKSYCVTLCFVSVHQLIVNIDLQSSSSEANVAIVNVEYFTFDKNTKDELICFRKVHVINVNVKCYAFFGVYHLANVFFFFFLIFHPV